MCDTLAATPGETARGAMLFAKNSDRERNEAQFLELTPRASHPAGATLAATYITIPQARETHASLLSRPFWMWGAEMGANEHGVVIGNEAMHAKTPANRKRALIGMDLVRLGLERGATAAEAADVIIDLLERHGQGGDCGHLHRFYYQNGFLIADAHEAYVLETVGRDWALERVSGARALSNAYSIGADYTRISEGLREDKPFDFAARMIDEERDAVTFGRGRCARGATLLAAQSGALTPTAMMAILRDHGEEGARPDWTPAQTLRRSICMHAAEGPRRSQTTGSLVSELRPGRAVHWLTASAAPCLSIFKPFVFGAALPDQGPAPTDAADQNARWWRHESWHRAANENYAQASAAIASERDALERAFVARIDDVRAKDTAAVTEVIAACWREADAAIARWRAALPHDCAHHAGPYHRSWSRLSQRAGLHT